MTAEEGMIGSERLRTLMEQNILTTAHISMCNRMIVASLSLKYLCNQHLVQT